MRLGVVAAVAAVALASGCGGGSTADPSTEGPAIVEAPPEDPTTRFRGGTVSPVKAAPQLGLATHTGTVKRIGDYRGRAVLVTFVYTRCPDICPLIIDNVLRVKDRLGPDGKRLSIVAVSVDPEGDTPAAITRFLKAHRGTGKVDYLVGSPTALSAVWARWGIGARIDPTNPALIEHSGFIWGVDAAGRRVTFYPATGFDAADIEHDVRVMLEK